MKKRTLFYAVCSLITFILWTLIVSYVDIQPIGPNGSCVGLASINDSFHRWTGVHMRLYTLTDWLSLIPLGIIAGFALLGLLQWIKRKRLFAVDRSILVLGGFYILVLAVFVFFEKVPINYRPVLIDGVLEESYPSSTTLLVLCVMSTAALQLKKRIKNSALRKFLLLIIIAFTALMVFARLVSGVHWFSDIIAGALLSAGLILLYDAIA